METTHAHHETAPAFNLALFLRSLMTEGRPLVSPEPPGPLNSESLDLLVELDVRARQELALDAPAFCSESAGWATAVLYHACRFVVCRDLGEEEMVAALAVPCPTPRGPETDWSVDLLFRHLPRVCQLAHHLSRADPLNRELKKLADHWPFSSVGIPSSGTPNLDSFIEHPALRRCYADRILAAEDTTRLGDGRVDELLRADLGLHHELAPAFARKLFPSAAENTAAACTTPPTTHPIS